MVPGREWSEEEVIENMFDQEDHCERLSNATFSREATVSSPPCLPSSPIRCWLPTTSARRMSWQSPPSRSSTKPSNLSQPEDLMKEVNILQRLQHPCITKVLEVVEDKNILMIVMEYAAGGEVFDQVVNDHENNKLAEKIAKLQF